MTVLNASTIAPINFVVSVLLRRENEMWAAQCLEYDLAAQGQTISEAKEAFEKTFVGQIIVDIKSGKQPLEGVQQAPREYWDKFKTAERLMDRKPFYMGEDLPPAYMIRAVADDLRIGA